MKKITLFFFVFLALCHQTQAQDGTPQKARGYAEIYGAYSILNGLNTNFATKIEEKTWERGNGIGGGLRVIYGVLMLEGFWLSETFKVKNVVLPQPLDSRYRSEIIGGSLNVLLIPQLKNYLTPYAGAGFASSSWIFETAKSGSKDYTEVSRTAMQAPFWNVGIRAKISRVSLTAAYRQSFNAETASENFSQLNFSFGYNFWVFAK